MKRRNASLFRPSIRYCTGYLYQLQYFWLSIQSHVLVMCDETDAAPNSSSNLAPRVRTSTESLKDKKISWQKFGTWQGLCKNNSSLLISLLSTFDEIARCPPIAKWTLKKAEKVHHKYSTLLPLVKLFRIFF